MAAVAQQNTYKRILIHMLNYVKPGNNWTIDSVPHLSNDQLHVTNLELMTFFNMKVWGNPNPPPDHAYLPQVRSNSIKSWKKMISFYMPNKMSAWDHMNNTGNPTRCNQMKALITRVVRMEARGQGVPSQARESINDAQFRLMIQHLQEKEDAGPVIKYGIPALCKFQFHMISRIDDSTLFFAENLEKHGRFPEFCLQAKLNWAKNVTEYRQAPFQTMIGAMTHQYCVLLGLALWLEVSLMELPWAETSPYVFAFKNDDRIPQGANRSKDQASGVLRTLFRMVVAFAGFLFGSHSLRKFASSYCRNTGATKDEKDLRGRWKSSKRISDIYDDVELPFPDAKVAALLCPGGPIRYAILPGSGINRAFIIDYVTPKINAKYGSDVAYVLGSALLWLCFSPYSQLVPATIKDAVTLAWNRPDGFEGNPVQKIPLIIQGDEGRVLMIDAPNGYNGTGAGAALMNDPVTGVPMGFQDRPMRDQMNVLFSQNSVLRREMSELRAAVDNSHAATGRRFQVLLTNLNRMAIAPGRMAVPAALQANNNNQAPVAAGAVAFVPGLSPTPRTLYDLWVEWTTGIGGRKPARDFTRRERGMVKYKFYRRKFVWDIVINLVNAGVQARVALDRIYAHYGMNRSVTQIINDIKRDKIAGPLPVALRIG